MLRKNKNNTYSSEALAKTGTLISEGAVFDGNLKVPDMIRVDGTVNGNCICQKELILGPKGQIVGNVSAQSVIISEGWTGMFPCSANWSSFPLER